MAVHRSQLAMKIQANALAKQLHVHGSGVLSTNKVKGVQIYSAAHGSPRHVFAEIYAVFDISKHEVAFPPGSQIHVEAVNGGLNVMLYHADSSNSSTTSSILADQSKCPPAIA